MKTILTILLTIFVLIIREPYPFEPTQMFLLELFVIGIPSFFLALLPNKDLIRGDFIPYVLKKGLPYGIIMLVNVGTILLLGKYNFLLPSEVSTLATMVLTISGFLNLVSLCYPYSVYKRLILISSLVGIVVSSVFLCDFFGMINITTTVWKIALALSLLTAVALVIIKAIDIANLKHVKINKLNNKIEKLSSVPEDSESVSKKINTLNKKIKKIKKIKSPRKTKSTLAKNKRLKHLKKLNNSNKEQN